MFTKCYKDVYVNSFFPCKVRPWNSLPKECVPMAPDLNGCKSKVNRHPLSLYFFYFLFAFNLFLLFSVPLCLTVVLQHCLESIPIKKAHISDAVFVFSNLVSLCKNPFPEKIIDKNQVKLYSFLFLQFPFCKKIS